MGRFGRGSTASDVIEGISLRGKSAIVTGASSGIGIETARVLAGAGAHVIMAVRAVDAGERVAKEIRGSGAAGEVDVQALDLTDLTSVRAFAKGFLESAKKLHLLVNNAGVMATPLGATKQGSELQVGTNHVGHFLLTKLLLPLLAESASAADPVRVVNVSSSLHKRGRGERLLETLTKDPKFTARKYVPFDAYGDSKLANVLFTKELANREADKNILAFSLHPGVIATNLTRSMGITGVLFKTVGGLFMKSVPQGTATTIYAAVSPDLKSSNSGIYLEDCQITRPSRDASDPSLATRLWEASEALTVN